ncbi:uncharacterized protein LOC110875431 [Helianthus annuus]|uniref:uncharacterized protein LOC110875431 n=1 Tax=Helianthus annuus TaxID=4232 RepID=UPI001652DEA9|nr:uncharacterized protein LOC110875431 [Helianthus annuus]
MNAVNCPLFPIAMSKVASMGHGYTGPSYHQVRVNLLKDAKQSVKLIVDSYREQWAERGCIIMSDGWRDVRQRALINILVYFPTGISFIKSVDASDIESNVEGLCNLFSEIVEIVGSKNIVHLVIDNAANYKVAGRLLCDRYPMISWSPCAAHCINLILKDVSELEDVSTLIQLASRITVFIYNHKWPLNWLRKRPGWTEIIRPGATRFGTSSIALKSLHDHKHDLQALVTSLDFKKMLKVTKANDVKDTILDPKFWNNCFITVQVMTPILRLLRICDSDEKPSLGYVYEGMLRIRKGIKELFKRKRRNYKRYVDIIDARWDKILRKSLHAAAYWLNPIFQYEKDNREEKDKAWVGVLDMIEKLTTLDNSVQITISHLAKFRDKVGTFGRSVALNSVELERPDEWWKAFGGYVSAAKICHKNFKSNRILFWMLNESKRPYDPVDYQGIDKNEFWVVEDEKEAELNYDDLENMLDEEELLIDLDSQTQPSEGQEFNEEDNVVQVDVAINVDHDDGDFYEESDSQDDW